MDNQKNQLVAAAEAVSAYTTPLKTKAVLTKRTTHVERPSWAAPHPIDGSTQGFITDMPEVGKPFYIYTDDQAYYWIRTSLVQEILERYEGAVVFKTMNTVYQLTYGQGA